MTLGKILTPISLTFSLALISTVLTACGEGAGIKIECSRPQDAFNASCLDAMDTNSVDNRLTQCLANGNAHDSCTNLIAVNTGDISGYDALPTTLPSGEDTGFVKIATGGTIAITGLGASSETITPVTQTLTGNTDDGYAYAVGTTGAIAAILPTTDLGAPVLGSTGAATWDGTYSLSGLATNRTISFAINFGTRTMTATRIATDTTGVNLTTTTTFNEYGAITGTFSVNTQNADNTANPITGSVMGLIGREGTVGVFHGANNPAVGASANFHAGGFIAAPTP